MQIDMQVSCDGEVGQGTLTDRKGAKKKSDSKYWIRTSVSVTPGPD